jgi:hypothetical protein
MADVGRPTKYDPTYCEQVIALGKSGASVVEMAFEIGVSRNTLETNWPAEHPEFLEALTRAREASQVWWEREGRTNLKTSGYQGSMWSRSMAARFPSDWRERREENIKLGTITEDDERWLGDRG